MINNSDKLLSIIQYAYKNVPYYKKLFDQENLNPFIFHEDFLSKIPILDKDTVLQKRDSFISKQFNQSDLFHDRTSGSTGKILDIYWEPKDRIKSLLSLWSKRKIYYNITPASKCCYFHSIAYNSVEEENSQIFSPRIMIRDHGIVMSMSKLDFSDRMLGIYYQKMNDFEPEWIMCHPSTLYMFAQFIKNNNLRPFQSLRYIELTGEYLIETHRKFIQSVFNVPAINEYGAREVNGIAFECPEGHLHCLSQNVLVEVIKDNHNLDYGKVGDICITGLNNRAMPFIRYNLGDKGKLLPGLQCSCGDLNPILEIKAGRSTDLVELDNGKNIDCVVFFYVVESINIIMNNCILQFQVDRISKNAFTIKMVLNDQTENITQNIKHLFRDEICKYGFENVLWSFEFLERLLPDNESGKLSFYINKCNNTEFC